MTRTKRKLSLADQARQNLAAARASHQAEEASRQAAQEKKEKEAKAEEKRVDARVKKTIASIFKKEFQPEIDKAISERKNSVKLKIGRAPMYARSLDDAIAGLVDYQPKALAQHLPDYLTKEGFKAVPNFNAENHPASTDPEMRYDAYSTTDIWVEVYW